MPTLRAKQTLKIGGGSIDAIIYILQSLRVVAITNKYLPEELVITSINDGKHADNSRHYSNEAVDIRSHNFPNTETKLRFRADFEALLGPKFRVLLESPGTPNEHFHAQVKKGQTFSLP